MRRGERLPQAGFTLVTVLVALALCMTGLALAGPLWSQKMRRDHEQDLLRIGALYAHAIEEYRAASPGSAKQYPSKLQDLLEDTRFVGATRYLRRLYPDPIDPGKPWGLVTEADGRISGVFSQSTETPLLQRPIDQRGIAVAPAARYADWKFTMKAGT